MTNILPGLLNQFCYYWNATGTDEYGRRTYSGPTQLNCQWEDTEQITFTPEGKQIQVSVTVFLESKVEKDGILMLGSPDTLPPATPDEKYRIQQVLRFQDIDNQEELWKAML